MSLIQSSIGRKMIMGVCGGVWALFLFGHMAGNMLMFVSAEAYNKYGHALVTNKPLLIGTEVILVSTVLVHLFLGVYLTLQNKKARKQKYALSPSGEKRASAGSRTMIFHGSVLLFFIVYHLITFKFADKTTITYDGVVMDDLHSLVTTVFQSPAYVVGYLFCLLLLGWHLSHGVASLFQTLGLNHPSYTPKIKVASWIYAIVVAGGFIAQPLYVILNSF